MNKQDLDAVDLLEVATHLGYFGYEVMPAEADGDWYTAKSNATWSFECSRWRNFLCLRRYRNLKKPKEVGLGEYYELVNRVQQSSSVTQLVITENDGENVTVHSWAMIPASYDRRSFGRHLLNWTRDADRLQTAIEVASGA